MSLGTEDSILFDGILRVNIVSSTVNRRVRCILDEVWILEVLDRGRLILNQTRRLDGCDQRKNWPFCFLE
jgi:hypothetical protein